MATVEREVIVHVSVGDVEREGVESVYFYFGADMSQYGYVPVAKVVIAFETPPKEEAIPEHVKALEAQIRNVQAKAQMEAQELREQINNLLALQWDGEGKV